MSSSISTIFSRLRVFLRLIWSLIYPLIAVLFLIELFLKMMDYLAFWMMSGSAMSTCSWRPSPKSRSISELASLNSEVVAL